MFHSNNWQYTNYYTIENEKADIDNKEYEWIEQKKKRRRKTRENKVPKAIEYIIVAQKL